MAHRILSIDLQSDLLTAVILDGERNHEILASTVVVTGSRLPEEVIGELTTGMDSKDCRCFLSLGASFFSFRNLILPFSDRKSIDKILPFELEESTASPIDTMLIDSMVYRGEEETEVIAAMIDRKTLSEWYAALQQAKISPEVITLSGLPTLSSIRENGHPPEEFIFLDLRLENGALFLISSNKLQLIRPLVFDAGRKAGFTFDKENGEIHIQRPEHGAESFRELALAVRQTLVSLSLSTPLENLPIYIDGSSGLAQSATSWLEAAFNRPCLICGRAGLLPLPSPLPAQTEGHARLLTSCLSLGMQGGKAKTAFNFSKEEFAPHRGLASYRNLQRLIALPLIAFLLLTLGYLWYNTNVLKKEQEALVTEIRGVFTETLPEVSRIVDPLQQLQVAIDKSKLTSTEGAGTTLPYTVLNVLHEISTRIPSSLDVRLTRLVYESKGLRLMGITDTFNTVDNLKKDLEQSPNFTGVTISSANLNPKDSKIRFELRVDCGGSTP
ncbi:MAG: PilN domain-containing protein [Proteobacteria bacterium]|nr:PilN domain-containing protein [Pseudomonadota bacterium]MBU1231710.1 PilN domain-containing protein [Pseudomonadota bacterium]MBU1419792.1 PilN domain-containing protein [Pseudomonadota bacterium]MBU1456760.1 PilN domain-containing protein [Pseudomonadota bacterium]